MNNLLRIDGRPSGNNSYWASYRQFSSNQFGSEITAGPAKWGFFNGNYVSGDSGDQRRVEPHLAVERGQRVRRRHPPRDRRIRHQGRQRSGTRAESDGRLHPRPGHATLNPLGCDPDRQVRSGGRGAGIDTPDFTYDNRLGSTAYDWLTSFRDNFTWTRKTHTFKAGGHFEYMQNNEARGGNWAGDLTFSNSTTNPLNTNFAFSNAILGVYSQYTETDKYRETKNRQWWSELYLQDTWQASSRVTVDYGARFLYYAPYTRPDGQVANFDPSQPTIRRRRRALSYQPAIINGTRVAFDPVTGQSLNQIFIGAYVPGTGNEANGLVKETDAGVPGGFRAILKPQIEPRLGVSWDLTGAGTTVLHSSAGYFHQARLGGGSLGNLAGNPPFIHNPIVYNGFMNNLLAPGASLAIRPVTLEALETDYKTPSSINWSVGLRREVGWGTAVDMTYSAYNSYNMEMYYDLNGVPDGARFTDLIPANRDPTAAASAIVATAASTPSRVANHRPSSRRRQPPPN